jgi:anti-sigma factor RsiW
MTDPLHQIWDYLHNELSPEDKERFEQALQNDPSLQKALEEHHSTHQALTELGNTPLSDEQLTDKLMAEWAAEHPEYAETPAPRTGRKILYISAPVAAAAAAVIFLFSLSSGPIDWQRTLYGSAPQLRDGSSVQPFYSRSELKQVANELQDAVEADSNPSGKWLLGIVLQELADGALAVEVSGRSDTASNVWKKTFQSLENFRENIPMFGKQIADEL